MAKLKAVLIGGPAYFPEHERIQHVTALTETVKHRFGAGYEHFTHQGAYHLVDGEELPVFQWTARTAIAE